MKNHRIWICWTNMSGWKLKMITIPFTFHQVWLWKPLPSLFKEYQKSWKKFNPKWKLKVWNEKNIEYLKYFNKNIYSSLPNYIQKSDYLRIIILLEFGGVYIDTDFECYKSINPLLEDCNFCIWEQFYYEYPNAFIGSIPEHTILKLVLKKMDSQIQKNYMLDQDKTWPRFISKIINQNKNKDIKIISWFLLYPEYWLHITKWRKNQKKIFASHHYYPFAHEKVDIYKKVMFLKQNISKFVIWRYLAICIHLTVRSLRSIKYILLYMLYKK